MDPIIRQIVARCHVGESNLAVIRYVVSRLKEQRKTFLAMKRQQRRKLIRDTISAHAQNRKLYRAVMCGA